MLQITLPPPPWATRFAPAPTRLLHLGHAASAVFVWGLAQAGGGRVVLRVEDHDRQRCRPEWEATLLADLDWLGLAVADGGTAAFRAGRHPWRQGDQSARYEAALAALAARGLVYPCRCTRREILRATPGPTRVLTAEQRDGVEVPYPGTCRDRAVPPGATAARRVVLAPLDIGFDDLLLGPQTQNPATQCGDLLARDRHGHWTYQFAVAVDDLAQGIDVVIRGQDLLGSTGRQIQLAALLGRPAPASFLHHPLLRRPDGSKLSKSTGDTGLADLRAAGWTPERVLGEAAFLAGLQAAPTPLAASDLGNLFRDGS